MNGPHIDHVGIAVRSLDDAIPIYAALLGQNVSRRESVPEEGVLVAFFGEGAGRVELLEPTGEDTPVGEFLASRGPGVHHVCLRVDDLEEALERAGEAGALVLPPGVRTGAGERRVAFVHPRSTGGVLLELAEAAPESETGGGRR